MSRLDYLERNLLINGGLDAFQRNFSSAVNLTTTLSYLNADRFVQAYSGTVTGTPTTARSGDVPSNGKSLSSLALSCQRNASPVTLTVSQRVESYNAMEVSGEFVSVSTWYKFPVATQLQLVLLIPNAQDNHTSQTQIYSSTITVTADNTWRQAVFEAISLPNVSLGLSVRFNIILPTGTDASATTHRLTQMKMGKGYKATAFCRSGNSYQEEILLCQRYYEKSYDLNVAPGTISGIGTEFIIHNNTSSSGQGSRPFRVTKRVAPVVTTYRPNALNTTGLNNFGTGATASGTCERSYEIGLGSSDGQQVSWHFVADAEI